MITNKKLIDTLLEIFNYIMNFDSTTDYYKWNVGITNCPDKKEIQKKNKTDLLYYKSWNFENMTTANTVKSYLVEKGCKECISALTYKTDLDSFQLDAAYTYVYVYKNESKTI
jgi:hypothetical protein